MICADGASPSGGGPALALRRLFSAPIHSALAADGAQEFIGAHAAIRAERSIPSRAARARKKREGRGTRSDVRLPHFPVLLRARFL